MSGSGALSIHYHHIIIKCNCYVYWTLSPESCSLTQLNIKRCYQKHSFGNLTKKRGAENQQKLLTQKRNSFHFIVSSPTRLRFNEDPRITEALIAFRRCHEIHKYCFPIRHSLSKIHSAYDSIGPSCQWKLKTSLRERNTYMRVFALGNLRSSFLSFFFSSSLYTCTRELQW